MNNGLILGVIAIAVVAVGGVGAYMVLGNNALDAPEEQAKEASDVAMSNDAPSSLRDLMSFANNQECSFTDDESASSGTVYAGDGKVRGDFNSTVDGTTTVSHVYSDGTDMYVWFDGGEGGFRGNLDDIQQASAQFEGSDTKTLDPDKQVDFSCQSWTVDSSRFELPDIEFTDYGQMMESLPSGITSDTNGEVSTEELTDQCSACDSLPGDAATQCRQLLSC